MGALSGKPWCLFFQSRCLAEAGGAEGEWGGSPAEVSRKAKGQEPTNPQTQGEQAQQDTTPAASEPDSLAPRGSRSDDVRRERHLPGTSLALQSSLGPLLHLCPSSPSPYCCWGRGECLKTPSGWCTQESSALPVHNSAPGGGSQTRHRVSAPDLRPHSPRSAVPQGPVPRSHFQNPNGQSREDTAFQHLIFRLGKLRSQRSRPRPQS